MTMTKTSNNGSTLLFVTSETRRMGWLQDPKEEDIEKFRLAKSGIYSCTVHDYYCQKPQNVALSQQSDYKAFDGFFLNNLNFFVSSKDKQDSTKSHSHTEQIEGNEKTTDDGNSYLYGGAMYSHKHDFNLDIFSWEILRAQLDNNGNPQFHTYFKTMDVFDWNNCDFDCCPFNDEPDSNGYQTHRDRHYFEFMHSYIRTIPRAFAVDKKTGDVFISWEGFYKNCNPANHFSVAPTLEWTVGISRLKTHAEDPDCVAVVDENGVRQNFHEMSNNFSKCTEPVSIVAMEAHGRDIQLPYGGLTIIPAAEEEPSPGVKPKRTFLMSVFDPKVGETHLWAVPEGADVTQNMYKRQELHSSKLGPHIFQQSKSIWNGGNIKVHYNQATGRPDHVCRSVFDKGIRCMPIEVTEDVDATYVAVRGDEETFLTETQVHSFCSYYPEVKESLSKELFYAEKSQVVTGLDVVWNEEDGTPQKIFFGCFGLKSAGRLGSVEKGGGNLTEALPGAYSGDVICLPRELEVSTVRTPLYGEVPSSLHTNNTAIGLFVWLGIASAVVVAGIALYRVYKKRSQSPFRSAYPIGANNSSGSVPAKYMELPVISTRSNSTAELSSSSSCSSELSDQ